jgi:hypothetical protein
MLKHLEGQGDGRNKAVDTLAERMASDPIRKVVAEHGDWVTVRSGRREARLPKRDLVLLRDAPAFYTGRIKAEPNDAGHHLHRGLAQSCLGQIDAAATDFSASIRLDPTRPLTFVERGFAWNRRGSTTRPSRTSTGPSVWTPRTSPPSTTAGNSGP